MILNPNEGKCPACGMTGLHQCVPLSAQIYTTNIQTKVCSVCQLNYYGERCWHCHDRQQREAEMGLKPMEVPCKPAVRVEIDLLLKLYGESYKHDPISEVTESVKNRIIEGFRELEEMAFK